ncbi:unnamed protein product [Didymodactylos carnosus]|uniref:Uncharacterized protein n=1 Tax=Didymodactylos carnosus TaxID=1234261 RepID=A0A8S2EGH3_9BILA|nr:unnamed protein product [Didymodactylos carnosus]CAF3941562.1 unnamed protein product [Didymodactylos carnosus]
MTSNKAKRYLQNKNVVEQHSFLSPPLAHRDVEHHKKQYKFTSRRPSYQKQDLIPPIICVDKSTDNEQEEEEAEVNNTNTILDEFDRVLDNELIMSTLNVHRTFSLKQQPQEHLAVLNQPRSFSFALGSSTKNLDDSSSSSSSTASLSSSSRKLPRASPTAYSSSGKTSLSKETFSRLLASLAFRQKKRSVINRTLQPSQTCSSCQNRTYSQLEPKHKKRPSIFGALVAKLSTNVESSTPDSTFSKHCHLCKNQSAKSIFHNSLLIDAHHPTSISSTEQQQQQQTTVVSSSFTNDSNKNYFSSSLSKKSRLNLNARTKRRRSLPSLFHSLFDFDSSENKAARLIIDSSSSSQRQRQRLSSFSSILTNSLLDSMPCDSGTNHSLTKVQNIHLINQKTTTTTTNSSSTSSMSNISNLDDDGGTDDVTKILEHRSHVENEINQTTNLLVCIQISCVLNCSDELILIRFKSFLINLFFKT